MPTQGEPRFTFRISSEELLLDGNHLCRAYSGKDDGDGIPEPGEGKSDPTKVREIGVGPIPPGIWRLRGAERWHEQDYVMALEPMPGTETFGRSAFYFHADSVRLPGSASKGCICGPRDARRLVADYVARGFNLIRVEP